jgi:hypothetical protein
MAIEDYSQQIQSRLQSILQKYVKSEQGELFPQAVHKKPVNEQNEIWQNFFSNAVVAASSGPKASKGVLRAIPTRGVKAPPDINVILKKIQGGGGSHLDKHELSVLGDWARKNGWINKMSGTILNKNPLRPEMARQTEDVVLGMKNAPPGKGMAPMDNFIVVGRNGRVRMHSTPLGISGMKPIGKVQDLRGYLLGKGKKS